MQMIRVRNKKKKKHTKRRINKKQKYQVCQHNFTAKKAPSPVSCLLSDGFNFLM